MSRVFLIILDGVGAGEMPDAADYGDLGANTLRHVASASQGLNLPNMEKMGLGNLCFELGFDMNGVLKVDDPVALYGHMSEKSKGKDSLTGHFELIGIIRDVPLKLYPDGFPGDLIKNIEKTTGFGVIACGRESGTEIIKKIGQKSIDESKLIIYTSQDSVLQIAAHHKVVSEDKLYDICKTVRGIMTDEHEVGRVIARPFKGENGDFLRTSGRKDFSLYPKTPNLLTLLNDSGVDVYACGKIDDIFSMCGITQSLHTSNNAETWEALLNFEKKVKSGLIFANLIDFDQLYGHRNDPVNFGKALMKFDECLGELLPKIKDDDLIVITSDHGNDPTAGTDHTREYVPVIAYSRKLKVIGSIGERSTFADVGATVAKYFNLKWPFSNGDNFIK